MHLCEILAIFTEFPVISKLVLSIIRVLNFVLFGIRASFFSFNSSSVKLRYRWKILNTAKANEIVDSSFEAKTRIRCQNPPSLYRKKSWNPENICLGLDNLWIILKILCEFIWRRERVYNIQRNTKRSGMLKTKRHNYSILTVDEAFTP